MMHPDTFPKATVYVNIKSDEMKDDVKQGDVEYDDKLVDVEVDAKPIVSQVDVREHFMSKQKFVGREYMLQ